VVLDYVKGSADKASVTYLDHRWKEYCLRVNARMFANFLQA